MFYNILIVCEFCEAEFKMKHTMDERQYKIMYCPFCRSDIDEKLEDDIEWLEEEEDYYE